VSLPKGGGAIRDIGEKFSANPSTGTGALSIAVPVSPGRGGFTPSLGLKYDSGAGNGPFGIGWSVGVPSITRKTDKGLPRYLDADHSDVFILSDAEDLVPILDENGQRVSRRRTVHSVDYDVHFYRPRIEGLFARIERWVSVATGLSHFRTISRDNVISLYGYDDGTRIASSADPRRIFSYLLCRTVDDKGNVSVYRYQAEEGAGIDRTAAHEANRTDAERGVQTYLKRVLYGNVTPYFADWSQQGTDPPLPAQWRFEVVFDYGDHNDAVPLPSRDRPWPVRPDPFSTYRPGFEVRSYRRCSRILMFHHFPDVDAVGDDCLVRSLDLRYSDQDAPSDPRNPIYTLLTSITESGYRRQGAGYLKKSFPPVELDYSRPQIQQDVQTLDDESQANLPEGIGGARTHWVDLDGEGLSGMLSNADGALTYKRNLSPLSASASFGPLETIRSAPSRGPFEQGQQLLDLSGAGKLDIAAFGPPLPGFFERSKDGNGWLPFRPFRALPQIDWSEPNVKLIDVTGDGLADALFTENGLFTFYPSLGRSGFGPGEQTATAWDEERGPAIVLSDGTQTVFLADMSGDGLSDLVRVRNGEVCYWPNLGYGRFGAKVTMDRAPRFCDEERFDPRRIRLADIDGSGTTDLLYIGEDGVIVCFNQSGNAWADPQRLAVFPSADDLSSVQVIDLLGNGTACLVWSTPLPAHARAPLVYVDLMGGIKPHLLVGSRNNLGAETRIRYAPSTRFYLTDKIAGTPWVTRLPFPVQVVDRVEVFDWVGLSRFVSRYAYHHGHYDGHEREFRGFGMVEQWDTEEHRADTAFPEAESTNWDDSSWQPPVYTRTWFHTGAFVDASAVSKQYAHEYWNEPALAGTAHDADRAAMSLPDSILPSSLTGDEMREAFRALKGLVLRSEVYSADGSPRASNPYAVTEHNYEVARLQPFGPNLHAVFFSHARETLSFHYERNPDDPRVLHELTLEVDQFGNVLRRAAVGYPRRPGQAPLEPTLSPAFQGMLAYDQARLHISASQDRYTNDLAVRFTGATIDADLAKLWDTHRLPLPSESLTAEVTGITPQSARPGITNLFAFTELDGYWSTLWDGSHDVPYEEAPRADIDGSGSLPSSPTRRIVEHTRTLYRSDDLVGLLPPDQLQSLALPGESYHLALTPQLVTRIFGTSVTNATLSSEAGYVHFAADANWWIPSGRVFYSAGDSDNANTELLEAQAHFFVPRRAIDPFGAITRIAHELDLLPLNIVDPLNNTTTVVNDYRVLQPFLLTDPNGNRSQVAFDTLGFVAGTAVMGKTIENVGDSLTGFNPDLDDATVLAQLADPLADPASALGNATTRLLYDLFAYSRTRNDPQPSPSVVYALARETHVADLAAGQSTRYQHQLTYSDGFGRAVQKKAQAEPGPLVDGGPDVTPRWVGSGWTIFNNKGNPVRTYEPFFSATHAFEFAQVVGVSSVIFYDSADRGIAALHPDNTWEKTVIDAWRSETWDANDTALISDPRTDVDVGASFTRLLGAAPGAFVSWHDQRIRGAFGTTPEERAAAQDAAQKTEAHAGTPAVVHFDSLGRASISIADAGGGGRFATRTTLDTESQPLAVVDALGRRVFEFCVREPSAGSFTYVAGYDLAGRLLYRNGMDGGERRMFANAAGQPIRSWDAKGNSFRTQYDLLRRPTHLYLTPGGGSELLIERSIYGEGLADRNLCGQLFRRYDQAGVAVDQRRDFKGNVLESMRQLAIDYRGTIDWSPLAGLTDPSALDAAAAALLDAQNAFTSSSFFDALNRAIQNVTPHSAGMKPNVVRHGYDRANLLNRVDVWIRQAAAPTTLLDPSTADRHPVSEVLYNARAQRTSITVGKGTITEQEYDPLTFRLNHQNTTRPATFAADQRGVQDLSYSFDPVGNITRIRDDADIQNVIYFRNRRVDPVGDYTYDPLYRLTHATGRKHLGQTNAGLSAPTQISDDDSFRCGLPQPGDGNAMDNYAESYAYDPVGNVLSLSHSVSTGAWTRSYSYQEQSQITSAETSNRLSSTSLPGDPAAGPYSASYAHDAHGNMVRMPHLPSMAWDERDQLRSTTRQVVVAGTPETTFYVSGPGGQRLRKITDGQASSGQSPIREYERIYLGGFEIHRTYQADGVTIDVERETLHVSAGSERVVLFETRTAGQDPGSAQLDRYQHTNHLGSALLELDGQAQLVSYEEYFPFGGTAYQAVQSQTETPKRYRFVGKERDEENGLYYHGARYSAPWLGRWTSADPAGLVDGPNLYAYCSDNPIVHSDRSGTESIYFTNKDVRRHPESHAVTGHRHRESAKAAQAPPVERMDFSGEEGLVVERPETEHEKYTRVYKRELAKYEKAKNAPRGIDTLGKTVFFAAGVVLTFGGGLAAGGTLTGTTITALGGFGGGYGAEKLAEKTLPKSMDPNVRELLSGLAGVVGGFGGGLAGGAVGNRIAPPKGLSVPEGSAPPTAPTEPAPPAPNEAAPPAASSETSAPPGTNEGAAPSVSNEPAAPPPPKPAEPPTTAATPKPRGSNNPVTRAKAKIGQEAHRQIERELKLTEGHDTEVTVKLKGGQTVRKDAMKGNEAVIIKPDTPTGRAAAATRADLMRDNNYDPRVILYDPADPRFQPGSPTYIGPKK
jgi:RHS repeat-associated protein